MVFTINYENRKLYKNYENNPKLLKNNYENRKTSGNLTIRYLKNMHCNTIIIE